MATDLSVELLFDVIESLDSAFLARQGKGSWNPAGWGERFFTALQNDHAEWMQDVVSVYATARQMLLSSSFRQPGEEFGISIHGAPEAFVRTVLTFTVRTTHTLN